MSVEYLDLADYIAIAAEVTGLDIATIMKVASLALADSALHAPAAGFDQDGVADAPLQCTHRFFAGLPFGLFAEVVDASGSVVADLGDGGHVQCVVQLAVTARVQPVPFLRSR